MLYRDKMMTTAQLVDKYINEVGNFYELPKIEINIHLIQSRKEFDKTEGRKTADWEVGFTRNNTIYIFDRIKFEEFTPHANSDFGSILKHEISHVYFKQIKSSGYPNWLDEGTACYVAGQEKEANPKDVNLKTLRNYYKNADKDIYVVGLFMVEKIIVEFGKNKLFELIKMETASSLYSELKKMFKWLE